jgi:predicted SnoaL-like aldol condensation-catalyzing enzyme
MGECHVGDYPCASPDSAYTEQERRNRDVVMAFYDDGVNRRDLPTAVSCLGPKFIQHSPHVADGPQGLIDFFTKFWQKYPEFRIEVKRLFIEGDMAAAHTRSHGGPNSNCEAGVDIFRLDHGKIVEHWEVVRPIPDNPANANSMF